MQVILEPGIAKIPVVNKEEAKAEDGDGEKSDKIQKIIKIDSPIYFNGLRRNAINRRAKSKDENAEKVYRAMKQGKKTFENSVMLENWKNQNKHSIKKNVKRVRKSSRGAKIKVRNFRRADVPNRKSEIDREMKVHGKTGGLKIKTGKHGTKLESHSGFLNVFIRNPDQSDEKDKNTDSNSDRRSPPSNSNYHVIDSVGISIRRDTMPKGCEVPPCPT